MLNNGVDDDLAGMEADHNLNEDYRMATANITTVDLEAIRAQKLKREGLYIISEGDESNCDTPISNRSSFAEEVNL